MWRKIGAMKNIISEVWLRLQITDLIGKHAVCLTIFKKLLWVMCLWVQVEQLVLLNATKYTCNPFKYPTSIKAAAVADVYITWFKKGGQIERYLLYFSTMRVENFSKRGLSLCSPPKNNVRPTISACKNLHYSPHRKSGLGSKQTCPSSPRPAPYSEKYILAVSHWLRGATVLESKMWLVAIAVHLIWREVWCRCGSTSVAGQPPLEDE